MADTDNQELLGEFLTEAGELLDGVDRDLVELEKSPDDGETLNRVFRGFHTIKGGAGFLEAEALVALCHRTENLFDRLRGGKLVLTPPLMDVIMAATGEVRRMFGEMSGGASPAPAPGALLASLEWSDPPLVPAPACAPATATKQPGIDWQKLFDALVPPKGPAPATAEIAPPPAAAPLPAARPDARKPAPKPSATADSSIRVDTARYDQILNLTGEIGLVKNRIACLRSAAAAGEETGKALDQVVSAMGALVSELQSAVMKARMQPVGRVFQKYNRLARDLVRQLGKEAELEIDAEGTEIDKTILDALNDPLVHLVRNAIDHGIEMPADREAAGKPRRATIRLAARQAGDRIVIEVSDDGRGMRAETIRAKAIEKGLVGAAEAAGLDERASLALIFLPGFSTKDAVSDLSGRGVGMDVVRTNIEKLNGRIEIHSEPGRGSRFVVSLPLTLAILPVLMIGTCGQRYALPLAAVHEVIELGAARVEQVAGRDAVMVRGEPLPFADLAQALGRSRDAACKVAVITQCGEQAVALGADVCYGRDEVMLKPLTGFKPRGVAGATVAGDGSLVIVLELTELLNMGEAI